MNDILQLGFLRRFSDLALLAARIAVGAFLVWGVWDNIVSAERMAEFAAFLQHFGFPWPSVLAPVSVWVQFACGIAFMLGLLTRWAGLLCAATFIIALIMVDAQSGVRAAWPATALVLFGLYFATAGAGRLALDSLFPRPKS